ncbi:MAG TPA: DegT/DnrJ/EryC1/StrS family aminotransferase, partial [Terriglobales bacterium]|nr:DegT/DnrJ/EryC1/StrS family aminotransferase [Terriglobales bacterium]
MYQPQGMIPFLDLVTPHRELEEELIALVRDCVHNAQFIGGKIVEDFEKDFAKFSDSKFCVGLASGTDAVRFALMAAGVKEGDLVATTPHTFIATTEAISQAGARPVFVDIDEQTYNLDPKKLQSFFENECMWDAAKHVLTNKKLNRPVTAIVPVHLYGQMADMDAILEIAAKYNLIVVEDACQAHGAKYFSKKENRWRTAGSLGVAGAFSFYPGKNLGACGEAGAATTDNEEMAKKMKMIRDHGQAKKYYHDIEGYNGRLDTIQAGMLHIKLKHLADWTEKRQQLAKEYARLFAGVAEINTPVEPSFSKAVYHLYVVRVKNREKLQADLAAANIGTGIHYPIPLHQQKAYAHLGYKTGDFPVTEKIAPEIMSLPM